LKLVGGVRDQPVRGNFVQPMGVGSRLRVLPRHDQFLEVTDKDAAFAATGMTRHIWTDLPTPRRFGVPESPADVRWRRLSRLAHEKSNPFPYLVAGCPAKAQLREQVFRRVVRGYLRDSDQSQVAGCSGGGLVVEGGESPGNADEARCRFNPSLPPAAA
jgi:hypothetical protein